MRRSQPPKRAAVADTCTPRDWPCGPWPRGPLSAQADARQQQVQHRRQVDEHVPHGAAERAGLAAPAGGSSAGAPAVRCGCRASRCANCGVHRLALRARASQAEPGVAGRRRGRHWQLPCRHCPGRSRAGWPLCRRPLCRGQHALLQGAAQGTSAAPAVPGCHCAWLFTPCHFEWRPPGRRFGSANWCARQHMHVRG